MAIIGSNPPDANSVNNFAGGLASTVYAVLRDARAFNTWLLATNLQTAYGFTVADEATIKSAFADMKTLADIHDGLATQGTLKDFNTFTKLIRRPA